MKFKEIIKRRLMPVLKNPIFYVISILLALLFTLQRDDIPVLSNFVSSNSKELPIYCVETEKKYVSISFDAAWGNEDTAEILEILERNNVKTTFFMTGGWVNSYPDDVKAIAAAGHDLGNHSENHKNMSQLSTSDIEKEIMDVHNRVLELTGVKMELFRPPYGDYDDEVIKKCYDLKYYPIQWNIDSLDWKNYGKDDIVNRVVNHKDLKNGSIILMHNGAKYTAAALQEVIDGLRNKGYEIVPISELIIRENFKMDHTGMQIAK